MVLLDGTACRTSTACVAVSGECVEVYADSLRVRQMARACLVTDATLVVHCGLEGLIGRCTYRQEGALLTRFIYDADGGEARQACDLEHGTWQGEELDSGA